MSYQSRHFAAAIVPMKMSDYEKAPAPENGEIVEIGAVAILISDTVDDWGVGATVGRWDSVSWRHLSQ